MVNLSMVVMYDIKNPPKRKIPKGRVSRDHHYVMIFPTDFIGKWGNGFILKGFPYSNYWDSFLEDCHKRIYKHLSDSEIEYHHQYSIYTSCLN